jgi:hypothetical protein
VQQFDRAGDAGSLYQWDSGLAVAETPAEWWQADATANNSPTRTPRTM